MFRGVRARMAAYGRVESIISALGILVLGCCFVLWNLSTELSVWGRCSALFSLMLFIWVCLNFVPVWLRSWRERGLHIERLDLGYDHSLTVFFGLLVFCLGMTLLVWLIRLAQGYSEGYFQSLQYWTYMDSHHYLDIARDWYLSEGEWDRLVQLVFLPGYPVAIRLVRFLVRDYLAAALLVSAFSFAGAGVLLYRLFRLDYGSVAALRTVKYHCLLPGSFFFAAPMSEGLFLLCCAGCLYLVRRGKIGLGCLVGGYAAFTRSLGLMLFAPVFFELVQSKRGWKRFFWLALIPAGFGVYCYINYLVAGDPLQIHGVPERTLGAEPRFLLQHRRIPARQCHHVFERRAQLCLGPLDTESCLELFLAHRHDTGSEAAASLLLGLVHLLLRRRNRRHLAFERTEVSHSHACRQPRAGAGLGKA